MCDRINIIIPILLIISILYLLLRTKSKESFSTGLSVLEFIASKQELSVFNDLITKFEMKDKLSKLSNFTFFVPHNSAFNETIIATINNDNIDKIVNNHIIMSKQLMEQFVLVPEFTAFSGFSIRNNVGLRFMVNNSRLLCVDNEVGQDGVVHIIDSIML